MRRFFAFVRLASGRTTVIVLGLSAVAGMCGALLIALVGSLFRDLQAGVPVAKVGGIGVLVLTLTGLEYLAKRLLLRSSEQLAHRFRLDFVRWHVSRPLASIEKQVTMSPIATFSEDVRRISLGLEYVPELGISLAAIAGGALYLSWVSWPVMLVALLAIVPAAWVFLRIQRHVRSALLTMLEARDRSNDYFRTIIAGIKELKLDPGKTHDIVTRYLAPASEHLSNASRRLALMYTAGTLWTQFCYFGAIMTVLLLVAVGDVSTDIVAPYVLVALFLRSYIYRFMSALPHWTAAGAVLNRLDDDGFRFAMDEERALSNAPVPIPCGVTDRARATSSGTRLTALPDIRVRDVCYRYASERDTTLFTAGPFDLALQAPEIVFVTGQNGVGKSTFLKTLCGLYTAHSGTITLDGQTVDEHNIDWYRSHFSALFTVPHVFPEIPLAWPQEPVQAARFEQYLQLLQLDGKISPHRGARIPELSHGQTRRLALLQALMDDRPVLLLDEWAENQDPAYKRIFYYDILPSLRDAGRIIVAITHESHYFDAADRLYELQVRDGA